MIKRFDHNYKNEYKKRYIRTIRWYTRLCPYIYMIDQLQYNTKTGSISFYSFIRSEDKYVRAESEIKKIKITNKNNKIKMGRPKNTGY